MALRLLERSAESGHAPSQFEVGKMYADVKLAEVVRERGKNSSDAVRMLRRAALQVAHPLLACQCQRLCAGKGSCRPRLSMMHR